MAKLCAWCGMQFIVDSRRRAQKFCSVECTRAKRRADNRACGQRRYAERKVYRSIVSFPNCSECGRVYCRHSEAREVNICSDADCRRLAHNRRTRNALHARRARLRGARVERVDPRKVFDRDRYRCHLCGKKTDRTKVGRHPKAPTVDHVIPLSRGGTHEYANCRTACWACNTAKGNRGGGEQLWLCG